MGKHCIINGPNLNLLGTREPDIYGSFTLEELESFTREGLNRYSIDTLWLQSNHEGEIIDWIQGLKRPDFSSLIINPGGYSHTSVAILDALKSLSLPIVEVHISNVYARESYRHQLLTAQAATTIMSGLGKNAYLLAVLSQEFDNIMTK